MSSLQRASQKGRPLEVKKGAFESCFASGLDLTEFSSASPSRGSAAAELLRSNAQRRDQAYREEREDAYLHTIAKAKAEELQDKKRREAGPVFLAAPSTSTEERSTAIGADAVFSTLVHTHGEDESGGAKVFRKRQGQKRIAGSHRPSRGIATCTGKKTTAAKKIAAKKSRRSKH